MLSKGYGINRLTLINETIKIGKDGEKRCYWVCKCDCGNLTTKRSDNLETGRSKSCGCLQKEKLSKTYRKNFTTHGMSGTRFYKIYHNMIERCYKVQNKNYKNYGGRGIIICDEWMIFENFMEDMYSSYLYHAERYGERNTTIERIDNNGNYTPENCKWLERGKQTHNVRGKRRIKPFIAVEIANKDSRKLIKLGTTQREFCKRHNFLQGNVSACLVGRRNKHRGHKFFFLHKIGK